MYVSSYRSYKALFIITYICSIVPDTNTNISKHVYVRDQTVRIYATK